MAKNEFLPFGTAEGANVLSNQEYERLAARFNGFISGVAKSKELNTVWRQSSVISSAIAQFIVDSDNKDLLDNGDVAGIKNRLVVAIKQTISGVGYVTTAAMNLELNKKIDKASISGIKGNDNDKVPSLNLFTTEIGKLASLSYSYSKVESDGRYQPKGNYQPSGDYATNTALNNGLNGKFDKTSIVQITGSSTTSALSQDATTKELNKKLNITGGNIKGGIVVESTSVSILSPNDYGGFTIHRNSGGHVRIETLPSNSTSMLTIANRNSTGGNINVAYIPNKSGHLAMANDVSLSAVPIGGSIFWNTSAPIPANYWANEGRSFSDTEYPEAAKAFPNLKLPDDRGYGIRVADNGRGIDVGRTVGTYQDDAVQNMTGNIVISSEVTPSGDANGVFSLTKKSGYAVTSEFHTRPVHEISLDISRQVRTSNETRMKNVAKILITRMK